MRKTFFFRALVLILGMTISNSQAQNCTFNKCHSKTFDSTHVNWWRMSTFVEGETGDTFDLVEGKCNDSVFTNFNGLVTVLNAGAKSYVIEIDELLVYVLENEVKGKTMKLRGNLPDSTLDLFQNSNWSEKGEFVNGVFVTSYLGNAVRMKMDSINCLIQWVELETVDFEYPESTDGNYSRITVKKTYKYELLQRLSLSDKVRNFIMLNTYVEQDGKDFKLKSGFENYELNIISK